MSDNGYPCYNIRAGPVGVKDYNSYSVLCLFVAEGISYYRYTLYIGGHPNICSCLVKEGKLD